MPEILGITRLRHAYKPHRAVAVTIMLNTDRTDKQRNKCTPKINTTLRFWVLTEVVMEIQVFGNVMPHPFFNSY